MKKQNLDQHPAAGNLAAIAEEIGALKALAADLAQRADAALATVAPAPVVGVDLTKVPLHDLVDLIVEQRGERSAAWLRTRLNQRLEARAGSRSRGGSGARDRVRAGRGTVAAAVEIEL
jgi:hypothetical protein